MYNVPSNVQTLHHLRQSVPTDIIITIVAAAAADSSIAPRNPRDQSPKCAPEPQKPHAHARKAEPAGCSCRTPLSVLPTLAPADTVPPLPGGQ